MIFLQLGGAGNSFSSAISSVPGQSLLLTCTRMKSVDPTPTISQQPSEAAERVHLYPLFSSRFMLRCSLWFPLDLALIRSYL